MLEQLARFKHNLHGGNHVCGYIRLYHREEPTFTLHPSGNAEVGAEPIIAGGSEVGQRAPFRNELGADFLVPEI